ncbi:hypothetical protein DN752_03925 [Echinicola strongylocentroti]|uniref:Uncharacterized protein n=1 Tax=Echinicola strongylocentroti TaxID=1795355 RepID=A0A2Z4IF84_9BACT|nr:hypothetical protein DN752_03925 [Echinicola strongylocentroti]
MVAKLCHFRTFIFGMSALMTEAFWRITSVPKISFAPKIVMQGILHPQKKARQNELFLQVNF